MRRSKPWIRVLEKMDIVSSGTMAPAPTIEINSWNGRMNKSIFQEVHWRGGRRARSRKPCIITTAAVKMPIEYWPLTLKSFVVRFLDYVLVKTLPTMRQHSITWIGRTRSSREIAIGSKTILLAQSKFEITQADRQDLVPSIVTAKHLDFFKAEPITKFKPGVFDDGMLQRMDASFLKAFSNPSAHWQLNHSYMCITSVTSMVYCLLPCFSCMVVSDCICSSCFCVT